MDNEALERKKKHVAEEYLSSLSDLQCNSKPLINVLTMLAEENIELAPVIVKVVEQHIIKVPTELKLPILYLIDSIVKNVKNSYVTLFGQCIVNIFCHVFEKVNEKIRERMYALRQTWNEVFPASKMYSLDTRVRQMDKNWPITAIKPQPTAIHVNPNFLKSGPSTEIGDVLKAKTRELLELRKRKLELELEATKKHLEEQEKALGAVSNLDDNGSLDSNVLPSTSNHAMAAPTEHMQGMPFGQNYVRPTLRMPLPSGQNNMMPIAAQMHAGANVMPLNMNKVKVHPVNPSLLNSIRQRDPRLMRQQMHQQQHHQQQQHQMHQQQQLMSNMRSTPPIEENVVASPTHTRQPQQHQPPTVSNEVTKRDRRDGSKSHKSANRNLNVADSLIKSSTRHTSSQGRSSQRSGKSSSSSSSSARDKDRERKRGGESKIYNSPSSSERRQKNRNDKQSKGEKSSSDVGSSPSSYRQSKSPNSSPIKAKETSRRATSNKAADNRTKNGQIPRSQSPLDNIVSSTKDIDLRSLSIAADSSNSVAEIATAAPADFSKKLTTTASSAVGGSSSAAANKGLEQNIKRKFVEPAAATKTATKLDAAATTAAETSRIQTKPTIEDEDLRQLLPTVLMSATAAIVPSITMPQISQVLEAPSPQLLGKSVIVRKKSVLDKDQSTTLSLDASSSGTTKSPKTPNQPPKVSFKIQKLFNKLAKSTENATATVTTTTPSIQTSSSSVQNSNHQEAKEISTKNTFKTNFEDVDNDAAMDIENEKDDVENCDAENSNRKNAENDEQRTKGSSHNKIIGEGKKRLSESGASDEPIAKKSKSTKMDALFGSQDVDLRTLAPPIMAAPISVTNEVLVAPPPPIISSSDDDQKEEQAKKRENVQTNLPHSSDAADTNSEPQSNAQQKASPSFEDVRAKFAKATKINRLSKSERGADKIRAKLAEVNTNDDENTQEANDEKVRIILSQAQEMYDSNSINKEQYKQLVQTVMSINENTKLKEAKRRESLQHQKQSNTPTKSPKKDATPEPILIDDGDAAVDVELMAARDAVLRKRIPKLSKKAANAADEPAHTKSPIAVDVDDERDDPVSNLNRLKPKEKRSRRSKWTESNAGGGGGNSASTTSQRPWQQVGGQQRNNIGMRERNAGTTPIPPPPQPPSNPLLIVGSSALQMPHGNWPSGPTSRPAINFGPNAPTSLPLVRSSVPPPPQPPLTLPPVLPTITPNNLPKPCNSIDNPQADLVRTIHIDGQSKDIRIYDDVAIVFMERDEPREIGFQPGQRAIIIDSQEPFTLRFNDEYKPVMINGQMHRVRFGFPSRELYIDEDWYEIYFGGPPVSIPIQNKVHILKAEGPPPQVTIGPVRRDLVVGRITMIVEAVHIFTLFLDARLQNFEYKNEMHTVQFADNLLTVLLDGKPHQVVYGGLPRPFVLKGKRYFIRFTTLPEGVVAGKVQIKDMLYIKTEPPAKIEQPAANENVVEMTEANNTEPDQANKTEAEQIIETAANVAPPALDKINIDELLQKLVSTGILNNNATKLSTPAIIATTKTTTSAEKTVDGREQTEITTNTAESNGETEPEPEAIEEEKLPPIIPIDLSKADSIKTRQEAIVSTLYSGMQCSSCGVRFPPEQTIKYSQHLDWHFRQNRRERDSTRKAHSRKWYYELNDWLQYEEIEDIDEREKNFFETQQCELDALDDISNQRSTNSPQPTCAAGPEDVDRTCDMCHEKFEQFYNEELEEWHLRVAIRVEDKIYHPLCYEDYKASLNPPTETDDAAAVTKSTDDGDIIMQDDDNAVDVVIKIEEDENGNDDEASKTAVTIPEDDDDDVIVLPNEEPSVTEIVDDEEEEYVPANVTREEMRGSQEDDAANEESDVEIQEPHIPFTDLDTYVEKELPHDDTTQSSFKNIKIKEEPKEDDEDDGFEDVGTVMYGPHDEISIQSSEETQTHTILSSVDSPATISGEPSPATNMFGSSIETTPATAASLAAATKTTQNEERNIEDSSNISMDGNFEPSDGHHNLSISGPPPAVPLGSLVNKIKINITKSSATAAQTAATALSTETTTTTTSHLMSSTSHNNNNEAFNQNSSNIHVVSTIPVLCGGGSMVAPAANTNTTTLASGGSGSSVGGSSNSHVSNITVIGSYGSSYQPQQQQQQQQQSIAATTSAAAVPQQRQRSPTPPIEETITFDLKPALQKATLKKMKKVECGIETSGLCSIM